jgi:adenylate cyclase
MPIAKRFKRARLNGLAILAFAALATAVAVAARHAPVTAIAAGRLDQVIYDSLYQLRPPQDMTGSEVVLVAVDQAALDAVDKDLHEGWPWPRLYWGLATKLLGQARARAVAFDLLFTGSSIRRGADDDMFAMAVDDAAMPVFFATKIGANGKPDAFAPPVNRPVFGATNVADDKVVRIYQPQINGVPSLAARAARAFDAKAAIPGTPFYLHYYGPHQTADGKTTFRYVSAGLLVGAGAKRLSLKQVGLSPDIFRGKIVLIGAVTAGTYDLKSTPLSAEYPGLEIHATAIENFLRGERVTPLGPVAVALIAFLFSLMAAAGTILPRQTQFKVLWPSLVTLALVLLAVVLFRGSRIVWLPSAAPLFAVLLATFAAYAWSYLTEGRQRQAIVRSFSQFVSPAVVAEIEQDPQSAVVTGERRDMTVMFTDIEGFTSITEKLEDTRLVSLLNRYLEEMSGPVLERRGTIDKYIGDAIMSFWNAPLSQPDHAELACRAALAMVAREKALSDEFAAIGKRLHTRIGLNTGPMVVGFIGSEKKLSYTVLGDAVNTGARLESANKFYGSQILASENTVAGLKDRFVMRELDRIRVKGRRQPVALYELLAEAPGDAPLLARVASYEKALTLYRAQDWNGAETVLSGLLDVHPGDGPAAALKARIALLRANPPPADWDGIYEMRAK